MKIVIFGCGFFFFSFLLKRGLQNAPHDEIPPPAFFPLNPLPRLRYRGNQVKAKKKKKEKGSPPERFIPQESMNYVGQSYSHISTRAPP